MKLFVFLVILASFNLNADSGGNAFDDTFEFKLNFKLLEEMQETVTSLIPSCASFSPEERSSRQCFEELQTTTFERNELNKVDAYAKVCSCLKAHPLPGQPVGQSISSDQRSALNLDLANGAVLAENRELSSSRDALLFQALTLSTENDQANSLTSKYLKNYMSEAGSPALIAAQSGTVATERLRIPKDFNRELLDDGSLSDEHCVSRKQFLAFKMIPDPMFFSLMSETNSFNEDEWNYDKLKMSASKASVSSLIKLKFLQKNPLIRSLLSVSSGGDSKILGWKKQLFDLMKKAFTDPAKSKSVDCLNSFLTSGRQANFRRELAELFNDPAVSVLVNNQNNEVLQDMLANQFPRKLGHVLGPRITTAISELGSCEPTMMSAMDRVNVCYGKLVPQCSTFEAIVNTNRDHIGLSSMSFIESDLAREDLYSEVNNRGYEYALSELCQAPRSGPGLSPKNFGQFRKEYCADASHQEECQSTNRKKLVVKFFSLYTLGSGDPDLIQFISQVPLVTLTPPVIESARNIETTVASYSHQASERIQKYGESHHDPSYMRFANYDLRKSVEKNIASYNISASQVARQASSPDPVPASDQRPVARSDSGVVPRRSYVNTALPAPAPLPVPAFNASRALTRLPESGPAPAGSPIVPAPSSGPVPVAAAPSDAIASELSELRKSLTQGRGNDDRIRSLEGQLREMREKESKRTVTGVAPAVDSGIIIPTSASVGVPQSSAVLVPQPMGTGDAVFNLALPPTAPVDAPLSRSPASASGKAIGSQAFSAALYDIRYNSADSRKNASGSIIVAGPSSPLDVRPLAQRIEASPVADLGVVNETTYQSLKESLKKGSVEVLAQFRDQIINAPGNLVLLRARDANGASINLLVGKDTNGNLFFPSLEAQNVQRVASLRTLNLVLGR